MEVLEATNIVQFDIWNLDISRVYNATDSQNIAFTID